MRRRIGSGLVALAIALAAFAVAGCGGSDEGGGDWALGSWHGRLHQAGMAPFQVWATVGSLEDPAENRVRYSGLACRGTWTPLGGDGEVRRFRETITAGRSEACKGVGIVTLRRDGENRAAYSFRGDGVESRGVLTSGG